LEDMLDEALADYVTAEPSPELERRVLDYARNHAARAETVWGRSLMPWLSAASIMLAASTILWLGHSTRQQTPTIHGLESSSVQSAPLKSAAPSAAQRVSIVVHRQRGHRVNRVLPKRNVFPTPSPLSSEERALLAYAERPPKELPAELTDLGGPIKPIQIAAIQIKPLDQLTPDKEN
jgi:hypothetical protein